MAIFVVTQSDRYEIEADSLEEARALWREYEFDNESVEFLDGSTTFEEDN